MYTLLSAEAGSRPVNGRLEANEATILITDNNDSTIAWGLSTIMDTSVDLVDIEVAINNEPTLTARIIKSFMSAEVKSDINGEYPILLLLDGNNPVAVFYRI